jgi:hypothetical protein
MTAPGHTGASYGTPRRAAPTESTRTQVIYEAVDNPVLRDVLPAFDDALPEHMLDPGLSRPAELLAAALAGTAEVIWLSLTGRGTARLLTIAELDPSELPATEAAAFVATALGVPMRDVLTAAGIAPRTFYSWRATGVRQPRLTSQGRLWELVQLAEDLRELYGHQLRRWMRAPDRRELLTGEDPQRLLSQALQATTSGPTPSASRIVSSAVGAEPEIPRSAPARPAQSARPARRAARTGRSAPGA